MRNGLQRTHYDQDVIERRQFCLESFERKKCMCMFAYSKMKIEVLIVSNGFLEPLKTQ